VIPESAVCHHSPRSAPCRLGLNAAICGETTPYGEQNRGAALCTDQSDTAHPVAPACRPGLNAAICDATTPYGEQLTALFFPDAKRKARHVKIFERAGMADVMPIITHSRDATTHQCAFAFVFVFL
jgi:hypothetical protein